MIEKTNLSVKIKDDWDTPSHYERGPSYFTGRSEDFKLLKSLLIHKNSGAILLCGEPGVGKTSLIHSAVNQVLSEYAPGKSTKKLAFIKNCLRKQIKSPQKRGMIPVVINAYQLIPPGEKPNRDLIIKNLIKRLYSSLFSMEKEIAQNTALYELYIKAKASIFEESRKDRFEKEEMEKKIFRSTFAPNCELIFLLVLLGIAYYLQIDFEGIRRYLLFTPPLILVIHLGFSFFRSWKSSNKQVAERVYKIDADAGNLEYDLEKTLSQLSKQYKLVFVIDELDKAQAEYVENLVIYFKNLFNLSWTLFIFIAGKDFWDYLENPMSKDGIPRSLTTLFTNKIFITKPPFEDLERFIDTIIDDDTFNRDNEVYHNFRNYLVFRAKSDFFNLYNVLRDYISYDEVEKHLKLEILDISGDTEELVKSRLQKALGLVYYKYRGDRISDQLLNNSLLFSLYSIVETFEPRTIQQPMDIEFQANVIGEAQKYLCEYLQHVSAITLEQKESDNKYLYKWTGLCGDIPSQLEKSTSFEEEFKNSLAVLRKTLVEVVNIPRKIKGEKLIKSSEFAQNAAVIFQTINEILGLDISAAYNGWLETIRNIEKRTKFYDRKEIENQTQQIKGNISTISNRQSLFEAIIKKAFLEAQAQQQSLSENLSLFNELPLIRDAVINTPHFVLFKPDLSKQVLVTNNIDPALIGNIKSTNLKPSKYRIINLNLDKQRNYVIKRKFMKNFFYNIENPKQLIIVIKKFSYWF